MIKFIYGEEEYRIDSEIKKFSNSKKEVSFYGLGDDFEGILLDISTISMFSEEKNIVIKNHKMFSNKDMALATIKEIENESENLNIIFAFVGKPLKTNALVKYLLNNVEVKEVKTITSKEVTVLIKEIVERNEGQITNGAAIMLSGRLPLNLRIIVNEIKKLLLETKNITEEIVEVSVADYYNNDAFGLTNAIVDGDISGIISSYRTKINSGEKATLIIGQIASILNLSLMVLSMSEQGYSPNEISDEKRIHIFRVKKALSLANEEGSEKLETLILNLAKVDEDIKTGVLSDEVALDKYLLDLVR